MKIQVGSTTKIQKMPVWMPKIGTFAVKTSINDTPYQYSLYYDRDKQNFLVVWVDRYSAEKQNYKVEKNITQSLVKLGLPQICKVYIKDQLYKYWNTCLHKNNPTTFPILSYVPHPTQTPGLKVVNKSKSPIYVF